MCPERESEKESSTGTILIDFGPLEISKLVNGGAHGGKWPSGLVHRSGILALTLTHRSPSLLPVSIVLSP
jgi:hypothetical protein